MTMIYIFMTLPFFSRSSPVHIFGNSLHSYARPPLASSAPNPSRGHLRERRRVRVTFHLQHQPFEKLRIFHSCRLSDYFLLNTVWHVYWNYLFYCCHCKMFFHYLQASSESESGVFSMSSSFSDDEDMAWSHTWPTTAWHCFLKGTYIHTHLHTVCFHQCTQRHLHIAHTHTRWSETWAF